MNEPATEGRGPAPKAGTTRNRSSKFRRRRRLIIVAVIGAGVVGALACADSLGTKASAIKSELEAVTLLMPSLKEDISASKTTEAVATVEQIRFHASAAKEFSSDPLWNLASTIPWLGADFTAVAEVARSADDVAGLGLEPLVEVYSSLNWETLLPNSSGTNLAPLEAASPRVSAAADAVRLSADRLNQIDISTLLPQVAEPLAHARVQLQEVTGALDAAADAANIAPGMLGTQSPRSYLLMIQNNAEARASGGIPGALAVLNLNNGKLTLGAQSSATELGVTSPPLPVDPEQLDIYSSRLGKYMQDVNLTPDFPTAASTAQAMWQRKTGQRVDGVIAIDPVALGYILDATGPVKITSPELISLARNKLPTELTGQNVVQTLLSDVYAKIEQPKLQDAYFAGVADDIFRALSNGKGNAKGLIEGLTRGSEEGRVLVWSGLHAEQSVIAKYSLSGSITGPSVAPAEFGVYFNDGTGAKMDYYAKRTVQLMKECAKDGYEETTIRVTSTNTAPIDAATSLPAYVTGGGAFGVTPGSVQTNVVAYGPGQANIETVKLDGQRTDFAAHLHSNRPVGVLAITLAPGESKTVEFTFGKIVQHTEPSLVVTPTVQDVKDVILPTEIATCD